MVVGKNVVGDPVIYLILYKLIFCETSTTFLERTIKLITEIFVLQDNNHLCHDDTGVNFPCIFKKDLRLNAVVSIYHTNHTRNSIFQLTQQLRQ